MSTSTEDFIRIWQASKNHAEVASVAGVSVHSVASRASRLRARGVPLKKFGDCAPRDYEALAALARECEPAQEQPGGDA